jgi:transcriptional regulator with XRE-family HTH domain
MPKVKYYVIRSICNQQNLKNYVFRSFFQYYMTQYTSTAFCQRLKAARLAQGLSQRKLGIQLGIDEFVASTRINRYEKGVHAVEPNTAQRLADVLCVPLAYFYAESDVLAEAIVLFEQLPADRQKFYLERLQQEPKKIP